MTPFIGPRYLGIAESAIKFDAHNILAWYISDRCLKEKRVWFPCEGGYLCFGKDAIAFPKGMLLEYIGVPMRFTVEIPNDEYIMKVSPTTKIKIRINKSDVLLYKVLGILK